MTRKATGLNPLDALIPALVDEKNGRPVVSQETVCITTPTRVKLTVQLRSELAEEARNAVVFLTPVNGLTLTEVVEAAVSQQLERLKAEHNNGEDFPPRPRRTCRRAHDCDNHGHCRRSQPSRYYQQPRHCGKASNAGIYGRPSSTSCRAPARFATWVGDGRSTNPADVGSTRAAG